jgi:hypothetical protein
LETHAFPTELRPLSRKETAELRGYVAIGIGLFRVVLFLAAVALAGLLLRALQRLFPVLGDYPWWAVPTGLGAWALYRASSRWTGGRDFRARVRRDLAGGSLAVRKVQALDAIEVEEQEDEGPSYFILTQDGRTILFSGQYLDRYRGKGFPWTSFEILEAPESGVFFGLRSLGERLAPSRRPPFGWEERKALGSFNRNYQVVDVDFPSLKREAAPAEK